jgi:uncharacterized SAM-binding protein YcdF (DUF218 family)
MFKRTAISHRDSSKARTLFQYLAVSDRLQHADLIMGFGVYDMRVPEQCASLYREGRAPLVLFTGGMGAGSGPLEEPEALVFRRRAGELGVPGSAILVEPRSTNTLENVLNSRALLEERGVPHARIIITAQPHRQRRVWLTCRRWFADSSLFNSPPPTEWRGESGRFGGVQELLSSMIGEMRRIEEYGGRGDIAFENPPRWAKRYMEQCLE